MNTVTATATGQDSQDRSDLATCETDVPRDRDRRREDLSRHGRGRRDDRYTITVENIGTDALIDVSVEDTLLGDITADFDPDLSAGLAVGATATATVTFQPVPVRTRW